MNDPKILFDIDKYLVYQKIDSEETVAIEKTSENFTRINYLVARYGDLRKVPDTELIDVILTSYNEANMSFSLTNSIQKIKICNLWECFINSRTSVEELIKIFKKK